MDLIFIRELRISTIVGDYRRERSNPQPLLFDIELAIPAATVYNSDKLVHTVNYAAVAAYVQKECDTHRFKLLERMADHLACGIITEFKTPYVKLAVAKLGIIKNIRQVGVRVERRAEDISAAQTPAAG
jgi:7,8-dihydroneopterin aldolase/epimerase/oxygenase